MGRRKIEIQPLTDDRNRTVTFVKRKAGLFKKAHELAVLCQVDIAVIIVGNNNKVYEFSSVDTNELLKAYKNTEKPHESKSPANYGNYKKKNRLVQRSLGVINDDDVSDNQDDEEYDSDTPEPPKRQKRFFSDMNANQPQNHRSNRSQTHSDRPQAHPGAPSHISLSNVPHFSSFHDSSIKEEDEEDEHGARGSSTASLGGAQHGHSGSLARPVLRVQIPSDAKNSADSARTVTAIDTQANTGVTSLRLGLPNDGEKKSPLVKKSPTAGGPSLSTPKFSSFGTFRSPATAKHITALPVPIQLKSQTSSPSSATAPPLALSGMNNFFNTLPQPSPSSQYPSTMLQTPIFNQMFNSDPKYRAYLQNGGAGNAGSGGSAVQGQATAGDGPMLGLPSRYVNDMFPSPYNFYVPPDWPQSGTGMTPYHNNTPHYFMNMQGQNPNPNQAANQNPNHPLGSTHTSGTNRGGLGSQSQLLQSSQLMQVPPQLPPPSVVQQQQQDSIPLPLQFMGQQYEKK